jgi:SagB-type dehydrogenase family enzyme
MADENDAANMAGAVAFVNSYKLIDRSTRSTGLRTHELRYRTLGDGEDARIAESFLLETRLRRGDWETESSIAAYFTDETILTLAARSRAEREAPGAIRLTAHERLPLTLENALQRRRSVRRYTGDSITLESLGALLRSAAGVTSESRAPLAGGGEAQLAFRTVASAGGLYPIDVVVAAMRVSRVPRGVYRYDPSGSQLVPFAGEDAVERLLCAFAVREELISLRRANALLLLVGQPWRSMRKYGPRGMRFVFIEAGGIAQNVALAATALGLGSVDCASTYDDEIHDALGIDGVFEALVHALVIGFPGEAGR